MRPKPNTGHRRAERRGVVALPLLPPAPGVVRLLAATPPGAHARPHRGAPLAARSSQPGWYLSLGDSLSQGFQPTGPGSHDGRRPPDRDTDRGYADDLARALRLPLVKLGCPGETTTTMLHGGICYRHGANQLAAATRFLQTHRGRVALITLDIGINDVVRCEQERPGPASAACLGRGLATVDRNLATIIGRIRSAAGPDVPIVALNYYAPFVAARAPAAAAWSQYVTGRLDATLAGVLGPHRVTMADTGAAFGLGKAPAVEAGEVCRLTWVCSPPPVGPDLHADDAGYRVMARSVEQALAGSDRFPALRHLAGPPHPAPVLQNHQVGQRLPQGGAPHPELDLVPGSAPRNGKGHLPGG